MSARPPETLADSPEFGRFVVASFVGHVLLLVGLLFAPGLKRSALSLAPVYVDLIPAVPAPKPRPAPRQTVDQPVVLAPKAKPKPKPESKPPEVVSEEKPKPAPRLSAAEILGRLRERVGEEPEVLPREASPQGRFDPQLAAYQRRVRVLLQSNWAGIGRFRGERLVARFEVRVDAAGRVRSLRRIQSSGSRYFDESAERAIRLSDPLPRPPRGAVTLDVGFNPGGVF